MKKILLSGIVFLMACSPKNNQVCGTYFGTLPAADGPGIETTLVFGKDNQLSQHLVYLEKKDGIFDEKGTYAADGGIVAINLPGDAPIYYRIEKNQLRRLDMDMQPVSGALEQYYILKKIKACQN